MSDSADITLFGQSYTARLTLPVLDAYEREFGRSFLKVIGSAGINIGLSESWFLVREAAVATGGAKLPLLEAQYRAAGAMDMPHIVAAAATLILASAPDDDDVGKPRGADSEQE